MKWKTIITELIGCKYPIISGAFAKQDNTKLVTAISKAGGCGVLTGSYFKGEEKFRNALLEIKDNTSNPFAVNFSPFTPIGFRKDLSEIFLPKLNVAEEEGMKTIITAGPRCEDFGKRIKNFGMNWIHKVTTMDHAIYGEKLGPDAIILTGLEGGGFKNPKQNTFFINMVNAKKKLKTPIIASGGISSGKGMLMAFIAGAQAVHLCTAFLATEESPIADNWKQNIIEANSFDPDIINKICHFESNQPKASAFSLAAGEIDEIIPAEDLINNIMMEGELILKNLGFQDEIIDFTKI